MSVASLVLAVQKTCPVLGRKLESVDTNAISPSLGPLEDRLRELPSSCSLVPYLRCGVTYKFEVRPSVVAMLIPV